MTQGQFSDAIFAQSVGGGGIGGTVEGDAKLLSKLRSIYLLVKKMSTVMMYNAPKTVKQTIKKADGGLFALGGDGGAGGDGGVVTVNITNSIYILRTNPHVVFLPNRWWWWWCRWNSDGKSTIGIGGSGIHGELKIGEVSVNA